MDHLEDIWQKLKQANFKVSTDSRLDVTGSVFFAVQGEHFDGKEFAEDALKKGAIYAVTEDSLKILQTLASRYRKQFDIPIIAIGGSNGKTTTKELTRDILRTKYKTHATLGNFNNQIGLPLSIFAMSPETEIGIFEIGANHLGEHTTLLDILCPTHVTVTNNGLDHLEGFGSPEAVVEANNEIITWAHKHGAEVIERKSYNSPIQTKLVGDYNLENISLALSIGEQFKVDLNSALKAVEVYIPSSKRSQKLEQGGNTFIVDCYNANPTSMKLSLESFLKSVDSPRGVILGDMLELGAYAEVEHKKILDYLEKHKLESVVLVGDNFKKVLGDKSNFKWFPTSIDAREWFNKQDFSKYTFLLKGSRGIEIEKVLETGIYFDSRQVRAGSTFVAIKGERGDGHDFIAEAIQKGAKVIVHEKPVRQKVSGIKYILVSDTRQKLAELAQEFYGNPSKKLALVGVTGTNGKTTIATVLYKLFRALGEHVALLSTIENKIDDEVLPATHTTPDPVALASFLSSAVSRGCKYAFMECSSHAVDQKRITGLKFAGAIFTNLTLDHLDYHKTMKKYAEAKKKLFDHLPQEAFALANMNDKYSRHMLKDTKAQKYFYTADDKIKSKLLGAFNAYNISAVFHTAKLLGVPETKLNKIIPTLSAPKGRLELVESSTGIHGVVDYAHTPDALANILKTLRNVIEDGAKIITVVGCGGNRDKSKRPVMGKIATDLSDYVFFTSDNPRDEKPEAILKDIVGKLPNKIVNYKCISDRAEAIRVACHTALPGDLVLLAGKGHEDYQVLKTGNIHFSDREELEENFRKIEKDFYKTFFKGKKITIMGLGVLGRGIQVTKFLAECGAQLTVTDLKKKSDLANSLKLLKKYKIRYVLGKHELKDFEVIDMVVKSAGVPLDSKYISHARTHGVRIVMDASLFARMVRGVRPPITLVGVTGTRGKSMTTALIYHILKTHEKTLACRVHLGGNMRSKATLPLLNEVKAGDIVVLELDSWQCQGFGDERISPQIAVFTNLMNDHMNYYRGHKKQYLADKSNIFNFQTSSDVLVTNRNTLKLIKNKTKSKVVIPEHIPTLKSDKIIGKHNLENLSYAYVVAEQFGLTKSQIRASIGSFEGLEGRLQVLKGRGGMSVVNDNNSTTPEAALAGIEAVRLTHKGKVILIAGGYDKGLNIHNLAKSIKKNCKEVILLPGTGTDKLKKQLKDYKEVRTLAEAVRTALSYGEKGDIVLFSPAFASFGLFKNEYDRNDQFLKLIRKWK